MILFLAGGFHFSSSEQNEMKLADHLKTKYGRYHRLCTFYYKDDAINILKTKEKLENGYETVAQHPSDGNASSREENDNSPA